MLALLVAHGFSPSAARTQILNTAKTVGGQKAVDAAAALGGCATTVSSSSTTLSVGSSKPGTAAGAQRTSAPATVAPSPTGSATPGAAGQTKPEGTGGDLGTAPSTGRTGSGGHSSLPLLLGLALLVVGGAPAALAIRRRMRQVP